MLSGTAWRKLPGNGCGGTRPGRVSFLAESLTDFGSDDRVETADEQFPDDLVTVIEDGDGVVYLRHGRHDGQGVELARLSGTILSLFPHVGSDIGAGPAYDQLREVQLTGWEGIPELEVGPLSGPMLVGPPHGLGRAFQYGLSFPRRFRRIVKAIEEATPCEVLRLAGEEPPRIDGETLTLSYTRFAALVSEIDTAYNRANLVAGRLAQTAADNLVAEAQGRPTRDVNRGRLPAVQKLTDAMQGDLRLDEAEVEELSAAMVREAKTTARRQPAVTNQLRNTFNLVSLEVLLADFRADLGDAKKARDESHWQAFFETNPFALQQLFGVPVVAILPHHLEVRSARSDRAGARVTDFFLRNALTREGLIVEIKTPAAELLESRPYRGTGSSAVHRPHPALTGAVAQLQSQKESLRDKLTQKLPYDDPLLDVSHAAPRGALIVGTVGDLMGAELESFRRYRDGLHDVLLLGFDEVAGRLQVLIELLAATQGPEQPEETPARMVDRESARAGTSPAP